MNLERLAQLYNDGNYKEAWWAFAALTARGENAWEIYLYGTLAAHAMGRIQSALQALERGMAVVTGESLGRLRFSHTGILMELGRLEEAKAELQRWLADLPGYPALEPAYLGLAYYNLGLICRQQELFVESIRHYATACQYLRRYNRRADLRLTLQNLAWVACLQGDEETASSALAEALPLCDAPVGHWHQQIGQAFLLTVSRRGDLRMAMTLCEEMIGHKGDDLPMDLRSHAYWLAGRVALELNLPDTARAMAEQALMTAVGADRCVTDAYRLLAEIDRRVRSVDAGKSWLN